MCISAEYQSAAMDYSKQQPIILNIKIINTHKAGVDCKEMTKILETLCLKAAAGM